MILTKEDIQKATYLGDGLYATHDGYQVWLFAYDGEQVYNQVALEPSTMTNFFTYVEELNKLKKKS